MGSDPKLRELLIKMFTRQYPDIKKLKGDNFPIREYTTWNLRLGLGGCRWCSRCLSIPTSQFGTKESSSDAFGKNYIEKFTLSF